MFFASFDPFKRHRLPLLHRPVPALSVRLPLFGYFLHPGVIVGVFRAEALVKHNQLQKQIEILKKKEERVSFTKSGFVIPGFGFAEDISAPGAFFYEEN